MNIPAFPTPVAQHGNYGIESHKDSLKLGMTLLDYFAAHANDSDVLAHMYPGYKVDKVIENADGTKSITKVEVMLSREQAKYAYARAMVEARK